MQHLLTTALMQFMHSYSVSVPYSGGQQVPKQSLLLLQMALSAEPSS